MQIAIVGTFQTGKSTLTNCLLDDCLAHVGIGLPTTHMLNYYQKSGNDDGLVLCRDKTGRCVRKASLSGFRKDPRVPPETTWIMHELPERKCLAEHMLVDTPGLDSCGVDASTDNKVTADVIQESDCVILVLPNTQLSEPMRKIVLPQIRDAHKLLIAVMNCMPSGFAAASANPKSRQNLNTACQLGEDLRCEGLLPCRIGGDGEMPVLPCNVAWWWVSRGRTLGEHFLDEQIQEVFDTRRAEVANCFPGRSVPGNDELAEMSNLVPLIAVLSTPSALQKSAEAAWKRGNSAMGHDQLRSALSARLKVRSEPQPVLSPLERLRRDLLRRMGVEK